MKCKILYVTLLLFFSFFYNQTLYANTAEYLKRDNTSSIIESLLDDGVIVEEDEIKTFSSIVGSSCDIVLLSLLNCITPAIKNLSGIKVFFKAGNSNAISKIDNSSFLGMLISLLLVLECIILGIISLKDNKSIKEIVSRIIYIILILAFISSLGLISSSILNIFTSIASSMSEHGASNTSKSYRIFSFMPSDILSMMNYTRRILSSEKLRIGGYSISSLVAHLLLNISEIIISVPYIYLVLVIMLWYIEFFLILLSSYITLPFSILSVTNITDMKTVLKSLILQGLKISCAIFLSSLLQNITVEVLTKINGSFTSIMHSILFALFITFIFTYIIAKGPTIILNAVSANIAQNPPLSIKPLLSGVAALTGAALLSKYKSGNNKKFNIPKLPVNDNDKKINEKEQSNTKNNKISQDKYGEVRANATKRRCEAARIELIKSGIENPKKEEIEEKAVNDAIIQKLLKMESNGFMTKDKIYNRPAAEQLKRLRSGK